MNCNSKITYDKNCNISVHELNYDKRYVYAYILQFNKSDNLTSEVSIKTDEKDITFELGTDGFYTLVTAKVSKDENDEYYYKNGKFYHLSNEIDLQTLIEINPNNTKLLIEHEYYFHICHLKECYANICQKIFNQISSFCNKGNVDSNLIFKRDLLWSAINVIEFMVEKGQFEDAEILLERIVGCNGLCDECYKIHSPNSCNCHCS